MRKTFHLPFPGKTPVRISRPAPRHSRWQYDPDVADPLLRLDAWINEGGAVRPKPL